MNLIRYGTILYDSDTVNMLIIIRKYALFVVYNKHFCLLLIMEKHILHANNLLADINKETCTVCSQDKGNIKLAILTCKSNLDTLKRHNNIHGSTSNYDNLEQVIQWVAVKDYLKSLL